jgi:hypothetical protein
MSPEVRERSFDDLARGLANGSISRGRALKLMGAALLGGTLSSVGIGGIAAADPTGCKRKGKYCTRDAQCCSGRCLANRKKCSAACVKLSNGTCALPCSGLDDCFDCGGGGLACAVADNGGTFCAGMRVGPSCATDNDCQAGYFCWSGLCTVACTCTVAC